MITVYDYAIIGAYVAFLACIPVVFQRFNRRTEDYFAGGFRMTWWLLGASTFVSNFSCWSFTGAAQMAYTYGGVIFAFYLVDALGYAFGFAWFAPRFRSLRIVTSMEAVRLRFGRFNEQFFTWLSFINNLGVAVVWMISLAVILSSAFRLPAAPVIVGTGLIVVFIALLGGNWAVAASHFVQFIVIFGVTLVIAIIAVVKVGGVGAFLAQIPPGHWKILRPAGSVPYDWVYVVTGFLGALYMKNNLTTAGKYVTAKDSRHARLSALVPLVAYLVVPIIWLIPPLAAFTLVPDLPQRSFMTNPGEASYIAVCLKILPQGLLGLVIICMLSATIGSMDDALNKNAGFFVRNFYRPVLRPTAKDAELLVVGRLATMAFGGVVVAAALAVIHWQVPLFDAFLYLAAFLGLPLSLPLFLGIFVRRVPVWSAWATALFGMLVILAIYVIVPTAAGRAVVVPWIGEKAYLYMVSNRFVMTNLIGAPLAALFFFATRFFYRPAPSAAPDAAAGEFFRRLETPVDFAREVGNDNSALQARLIGRLTCLYGSFIALLVLVPNPGWAKLSLLGCGMFPLGVGTALVLYARRADQR